MGVNNKFTIDLSRTPLSSHSKFAAFLVSVQYLNSESEALGVIERVERDVRDVRVLIVGGAITVEGELSLDIHLNLMVI